MIDNWINVNLGEICEIISGKNQKQVEEPNGIYPIYGSGGKFGTANDYLCEPGTTIIGRKGTINNPIFVKQRFWNVDTAFGISPLSSIDKKFVFYFCKSFNFHKLDKSTTIPSLAKRDLLIIPFKLAPLPEQRRIVSKLDELFSKLDNGIANLKAAKEKLEIYRQSVLKRAFEGELTKVWRVNQEFETPWKETLLGEIAQWGSGGTPSRKVDAYFTGDIPWIKTGELGPMYIYDAEEKITEEAINNSSAKVFPKGSIGIAMYGATIGKTSIFGSPLATNQACAVAYPKEDIDVVFLYYFILSQKYDLIRKGQGGAQPNISQGVLKEHPIKVPKIEEQQQIVQEIETRLSVCDKILENIELALKKSESLRQSILKKAFEGKLLNESELEECKKDPDWEPASKLLERIKNKK